MCVKRIYDPLQKSMSVKGIYDPLQKSMCVKRIYDPLQKSLYVKRIYDLLQNLWWDFLQKLLTTFSRSITYISQTCQYAYV